MSLLIFVNCSLTASAGADSIRQQAGLYEDNHGVQRQRLRLDATLETGESSNPTGVFGTIRRTVANSTLTLGLERDIYRDSSAPREDKMTGYYEGGHRTQNLGSLSWNKTVGKLTDYRWLVSHQYDGVVRARNAAVGMSQWIWHESIQLGIDVSRSLVDRPELILVDADTETINPPPHLTSTGTSVSVKHLALPTTVTNYIATFIVTNDRPLRQDYQFGVKHYLKSQKGAVHGDIVRSINRGKLENTTIDGQLDAWIVELAYLQTLVDGAYGRLAWRQYREDEVTRDSHQDELVRGTDLWSVSTVLDLKKLASKAPVSLEFSHSRYRTNKIIAGNQSTRTNAVTYEMGATAKF